jgi:hypothetical protein
MKLSNFEDEFGIPCELEGNQTVNKNRIESPTTNSSKLCMDKGFVTDRESEFFVGNQLYESHNIDAVFDSPESLDEHAFAKQRKSSHNLSNHLVFSGPNYFDIMKRMRLKKSRRPKEERSFKGRKRIMSCNKEFKLVPLLRRMS